MMRMLVLLTCLLPGATPFLSPALTSQKQPFRLAPMHMAETTTTPTLTESTTWKLRFVLRSIATDSGKKVDEIFVVSGQFVEQDGYEPPQGSFVQQNNSDGERDTNLLKLTKSRWQLSEDPDDRKDGLWIWGLFKEPLYPYMLLQLETDAIGLAGGDTIPPLQLYAQINHAREEGAVVLQGADLKIRQMETIKADPFGAAKVEVFEEVSVGTLSIQPVA